MKKEILEDRIKKHPNEDVISIDVSKELGYLISQSIPQKLFNALGTSTFPPENSQFMTGSDILVTGYPKGFFDTTNLFPIVTKTSISSRWGYNFKGDKIFLIDRIFRSITEASSGSLIITNPFYYKIRNDIDNDDDKTKIINYNTPQFYFLGIYLGIPQEKVSNNAYRNIPDVGICLYSHCINAII